MDTFESFFNALASPQLVMGIATAVFFLYLVRLRQMMRPAVSFSIMGLVAVFLVIGEFTKFTEGVF